jgi:hypothetical protein
MMLLNRNLGKTLAIPLTLAVTALLGACGGGGDAEAGSPTAFGVQPADRTLTALAESAGGPTTGQCSAGYAGDIAIVGGAAPYRMINTSPERVLLHRSATDLTPVSSVDDRNGTFSVSFGNSCFDPALVVVADKLDKQVVLTLHNKPSAAAPAASAASSAAP